MHSSIFNSKSNNIAAICSGNGDIRWIKLSDYYQNGQLTFIDLETENPLTEQTSNNCPTCSLFSQLDNVSTGLTSHALTPVYHSVEVRFSFTQHFAKRDTLTLSSRDPPFLI